MILREIFAKRVDREIEGVIKADDDDSLLVELEEYVLTNEIEKRLSTFFEAYNENAYANGAWISGFFGSGKSHLLKMLALVLESRDISGQNAYKIFYDKCASDKFLQAELKRACDTPSKSILFNIDNKSDVISKDQSDALLSVFCKVFDEMCGYYGKLGHIADMERDLDGRGLLEAFKAEFETISGTPWERGREQSLLEDQNISAAYAVVTKMTSETAAGITERYRKNHKVSIEDFANRVNDYISQQHKDFRLNFFVDEVGQYIADNTKLMTNLQTVAESLYTVCKGRAWIIVTSQQDMNAAIGDLTQKQESDFSKIMARFKHRMPLTSADVAEVIQKRLLEKAEPARLELTDIYEKESNSFKTLFDFADGGRKYQNFSDQNHFVNSYPFIPYQYDLFQSAITSLSKHNAFEGKHSSVGARSMLGVFQDVAKEIADMPLGQIASFDRMYEGLRTAIKSNVQQSIHSAERNLGNPFAIKVLKSLFLVKYVEEFTPNIHNICVLMLESFDQDIGQLKKDVEESLGLLEQQVYIKRDSDTFHFLTDEEKDIEREIKSMDIDATEISKAMGEFFYDRVIRQTKIRHQETDNDYNVSRYMDDKLLNRDYGLSINVISPFHDESDNVARHKVQSMAKDELIVLAGHDKRFLEDLRLYVQTEKYASQAIGGNLQPAAERIISDKRAQNAQRSKDLIIRANKLLADATLIIRGEEIEIRGEDGQNRIIQAFQTLVDKVYTNLGMLRGIKFTENEVGKFLKHADDDLLGSSEHAPKEAEQEIMNLALGNQRNSLRTTLKTVTEKFEKAPYGWPYPAILCMAAGLVGRGKLDAQLNGDLLKPENVERHLKNTSDHSQLILEPQVDFTPSQIRTLKDFYKEFFDDTPRSTEARLLAEDILARLKDKAHEIKILETQSDRFPFLSKLAPVEQAIKAASCQSYRELIQNIGKLQDELLKTKEDLIDPMEQFMGGPQKTIYLEAVQFVEQNRHNADYVNGLNLGSIRSVISDPDVYKGNKSKDLKAKLNDAELLIQAQVGTEIKQAHDEIEDRLTRFKSIPDFSKLEESRKAALLKAFSRAQDDLLGTESIAVIRQKLTSFSQVAYPFVLSQLEGPKNAPTTETGGSVKEPRQSFVRSISSVHVPFSRATISTAEDIDDYLKALREILENEIKNGKRFSV